MTMVIPDCTRTELHDSELREAARYLPAETETEWEAFALRQQNARRRLTQIRAFYQLHPCHLARTHLLAACAITLGRFCGYSASFDRIGEALMPVTPEGNIRTPLWQQYVDACRAGYPWQIREERWLAAHLADLQAAREAGKIDAFYTEAAQRPNDPVW